MPQNSKMLVGAVLAAGLAVAVYYGLISQQTATNIQGQASQTLGTTPASQQPVPPASPNPTAQTSAPPSPSPQNSTQAPRQ